MRLHLAKVKHLTPFPQHNVLLSSITRSIASYWILSVHPQLHPDLASPLSDTLPFIITSYVRYFRQLPCSTLHSVDLQQHSLQTEQEPLRVYNDFPKDIQPSMVLSRISRSSPPIYILLWNWSVWASLVVQWLRICLPMQGTRFQFLVWEDPTCLGATKPEFCNYWSPSAREPVLGNKRSHHNKEKAPLKQLEEASAQQQGPSTAKNKYK